MVNLIKLDWLGMKYFWKRLLILPLMVCFYGLFLEQLLIPLAAFCMFAFSVNTFAMEEKGQLDNLYLTLPVTRQTIVKARLGLSLLMQLSGLVFGVLTTLLFVSLLYGNTFLGKPHTFKPEFTTIFLMICASLLFNAIMSLSIFPLLFKLGFVKGKMLGFVVPCVALTVIAVVLILMWNHFAWFKAGMIAALEWAFANTVGVAVLLLLAAGAIIALSYLLSCRAYEKREF